ncbi:MAG: AgmX/PglI C-terminal domain-containing protein [Deltaproteobacteria bacterium]|nr:AgmX/PglI C-terminal domain-containing protein [Deltaproteobacteria bacterium]MCW5808216.1 AgmX/PglI C-terminal domain-containing protein [Deltaproteobacteria bacterium]
MATAKLALTFRILSADGTFVREEKLTQGVIKIGKVASAHLRIDGDELISRMHAIIEVVGDSASLIDLGSTGGTFVNGHKVNKVKLASGDSIRVGSSLIEVTIEAADQVADQVNGQVAVAPTVIVAPQVLPPPVPAARPVISAPTPAPIATRTATAPVAALSPLIAPPVSAAAFAAATADDDHGARAVEVAAMLGDSVVGVKHCMDPRGGKVTNTTLALLGGGAAALVASAAAFYMSIGTAARNDAALAYHRDVLRKPDFAFKREKQSGAVDFAAWGGLGLALGALTAGLARVRRERKSPYYRIGTAAGVEQPLEGAPSEAFPLVAPSGDDFVFNFAPGMEGEMIVDGASTPLAQLAEQGRARPSAAAPGAIEVPLPARARIRARAGQTTFVVSAVPAPRRHAAPLFNFEARTATYFAGSLALHLGIWAFLRTVPVESGGVVVNPEDNAPITARGTTTERDDKTRDLEEQEKGEQDDQGAEGVAATAMRLDEGKAGNPQRTNEAHMTMARVDNMDPAMAKAAAIERARTAGILGSESLTSAAAALAGVGDLTVGLDDATRWGGLTGEPGEGGGNFGGGYNGTGPGGNCYSSDPALCGIIGGAQYTTMNKIGGKWGRNGDWKASGAHPGVFRDRTAMVPVVKFLEPRDVSGGLTKDIIRRYIKRHHERFKYCYETELLARPGIEGTVMVQFMISANGAVTTADANGFDGKVASCVGAAVRSIAFPAPSDGSNVTVNYPFTFHAPK